MIHVKHAIYVILFMMVWISTAYAGEDNEYITIAILAKDKAHTLPLYLDCIEAQTWPKSNTYLYIRTNNNNDNTAQVLGNGWEGERINIQKINFIVIMLKIRCNNLNNMNGIIHVLEF